MNTRPARPCCSSASTTPAAPRWRSAGSATSPTVEPSPTRGGSEPADGVNPVAVAVMAEVGIDITGSTPTRWTGAQLDEADVVVTMGCGDTCPYVPGTRYEDWPIDDPAGLDLEHVRPIRDEIRVRVGALLDELLRSTPYRGAPNGGGQV